MARKILFFALALATVFSTAATSLAADDSLLGSVVKLSDSDTLYYIAADGNRYVYPNQKVYNSWFDDFSDVKVVTQEELADYPLAGNIRYRPGVVLVKIQTDPKVYAVSNNGVLRWIRNERLARNLYGSYWADLIDDIAPSFFANYAVGQDISDDGDYDPDQEVEDNDTVEANRGLRIGQLTDALKARTTRCRAIPASPHQGQKRAISARACKLEIINDDSQEPAEDKTAPTISQVEVEATATTATVTWLTNEEADGKVKYADESLATATTTESILEGVMATSHSVEITGLTASTTYYFILKSEDNSGNQVVTTEDTFTTLGE